MDQETLIKVAQARSIGFAQAIINRGCPVEAAQNMTAAYMDPQNGMFAKRAASVQHALNVIGTIVTGMRAKAQH